MSSRFRSLIVALVIAPLHLLVAQDTIVPPAPPPRLDSLRCGFCHRPGVTATVLSGLVSDILLNRFNAWVLDDSTAFVTPRTWSENLRRGWDWDTDDFVVNMIGHPYMGSGYYRAARTDGLGFITSSSLTAVHSAVWEYFGETTQPSINDMVNTTMGGIAVGEMFYRLAVTIRNNEVSGTSRIMREIAAIPFDPGGAVGRLFRGEWTKRGPNPEEHHPVGTILRTGGGVGLVRPPGASGLKLSDATASPIIYADLKYGDAYIDTLRKPFDAFTMRLALAPGHGGLTQLVGVGRLTGRNIGSEDSPRQLEVNQRFEYVNNGALRFGAQTIQLALTARSHLIERFWFRGLIGADAIVLAGIDAPGAGTGPRTYDFGPGVGGTISASIERGTSPYLTLRYQPAYTHTISGGEADHVTTFAAVEGNVPLTRQFSIAIHWSYFTRVSTYGNGVDTRAHFPELRLFLAYKAVR